MYVCMYAQVDIRKLVRKNSSLFDIMPQNLTIKGKTLIIKL